ncbi:MAG: hypothetical protein WA843_03225, partial [Candidatus Saccharimonadales bacterium]
VFGQFGEVYVRDSGVWRARNDPNGSGESGPVVAAGPNDITTFINGTSSVRHWDGISWRAIEGLANSPSQSLSFLVNEVGGTGGAGGAFSLGFRIGRFDGRAWITDTLPTSVSSVQASTTFGTDIVILSNQGHVWRQDFGTGIWTEIGTGGSGQTNGPNAVFGTGNNNLWALSNFNGGGDPVIAYWDGSSWTDQAVPSGQDNNTGHPEGGVAFSSSDAYIVRTDNNGHGHVWHWDGANWTDVRTASYNYSGIWARGTDDFYLAENGGRVEHDSAGVWTTVLDNTPSTTAVWAESSTSAYMATNTAEILHYDGSTWNFAVSTAGNYTSIWESGPNDIWVARSDNDLIHKDASSWTVVGPGGAGPYYGVGGSGSHDVWTVGGSGEVYHNDGTNWSASVNPNTLTPNDLHAVWAANANFAVAVGENGTILKWLGSSWALETSPTSAALRSVWGSGPSDVWAVGDFGVIVHYDGSSWSTDTSGTGQNLLGVWAASPSEVYAVGANKTLLMYNGVSWSPVAFQSANTGSSFNAISGRAGGQVLIAGTRILRGTR